VPAKWKENLPLGHWVHVQREFKKKGRLSAMRIALLESIGFEWKTRWPLGTREDHWQRMYAHLEGFAQEHGHAEVPKGYAPMPGLPGWVSDQREAFKDGRLLPDRRERLEAIGFAWKDTRRSDARRWEDRLTQLLQFRERFGHCHVAAKWKENIPLGHWVDVQRQFKKKGLLSPERIQRLESIGFEWKIRWPLGTREDHWQRMCAHLESFAREHGHAEVPKGYAPTPGLPGWVFDQREAFKTGTLRADRRERLEAIGFAWKDTRRSDARRWEDRLAQLLQFRERFGHCHVAAKWNENIPLGHWVDVQRQFKKKGVLSPERIQRLEAIGFEWHGPRSRSHLYDAQWAQMFAHLTAYRQEYGNTQVPRSHTANGLGDWVLNQRHLQRAGTMRPDRRAQLESISFEWRGLGKAKDERWERRFAQLLAFRERHGHCRVPAKCREDAAFGHWVYNQRLFKNTGKLSAERIRRLEEIGFEWGG